MTGLLNKVKQAIAGDSTHNEHHNLNTAAPRGEPTIGRSDPLHGGLANSGIHNNTTGYEDNIRGRDTLGTQNNTLGGGSNLHGSNFGSSAVTDTAGPHNSNVANKLDPRVDSDRDGRAGGLGSGTSGFGSQHQPGATSAYGSTTTGPHNSNIANKLDPRVDSDRDGRGGHDTAYSTANPDHFQTGQTLPSTQAHSAYDSQANNGPHNSTSRNTLASSGGIYNPHGTTAAAALGIGAHNVNNAHNTSTNAGPHDSNVANKLDPTVDSDRDGRGLGGSNIGGFGAAHNTHHNTTAGPHNSNAANKLDPRVDSDRDGRGLGGITTGGLGSTSHGAHHNTHGGAIPGTYDSTTTTGPHNSNIANKLDPTVDSDLNRHGNGGHGINSSATALGAGPGGLGLGQNTHGTHGTHGTHTAGAGTGGLGNNSNSTNNGPHSSNIANKLDPRVDSDRDGRGNHHGTDYPQKYEPLITSIPGTHTNPPGAPLTKIPRTTGAGVDSGVIPTTHGAHNTTSGTHGTTSRLNTHNTHDNTSGLNTHNNTYGTNTSTVGNTHGTSGVHDTRFGATTGTYSAPGTHSSALSGPAPNTAGPHSKDIFNKLDPRVDSNMDGSKTMGGSGSGPV